LWPSVSDLRRGGLGAGYSYVWIGSPRSIQL
jgi:hypothetical protein